MDPVEVNAGGWYLRALRSDERVDDRPALASVGIDDPDYVSRRTTQWADDVHYSWAVCEPTTGEMLAEIGLTPGPGASAELTGWALLGSEQALAGGTAAVRRFAEGGLGYSIRP